eukprot:2167616-Amphidinium_carterae.1
MQFAALTSESSLTSPVCAAAIGWVHVPRCLDFVKKSAASIAEHLVAKYCWPMASPIDNHGFEVSNLTVR